MGSFDFEKGLAPDRFNAVVEHAAQLVHQIFVLFAPGHREGQPVGVVTAVMDEQGNVKLQAVWMPWATPRNILEASLYMVRDLARDWNLLIYAPFETRHFFERLCNFGVLNKVGHVKRYFGGEGRAVLFQSR